MFCPNCGKPINDGDMFCAHCSFRTGGMKQPQNNIGNVPINYQPQNNQQAAPAEEKGHPVAIFFATMLIGCGLLAGAVFFFDPGFLKNNGAATVPHDDTVTAAAKNESTASGENKIVPMTTLAEKDGGETVTTVTTVPEPEVPSEDGGRLKIPRRTKKTETVTEVTEAPVTTTTVTTSERSEVQIKLEEARRAEAQQFSTNEKPEFSDFEWCYGQNGQIREPPSDSKTLPVWDQWVGGWKGFAVYVPTDADSKFIREVNNVDISIVDDKVTVTVKHHLYEMEGEEYDDSITADFVYTGYVVDHGIDVQGEQHMVIKSFWKKDGHEYAVGNLTDKDGNKAYIALMR